MRKAISEKRLAANRANATKSTGPRTPEGKARSSLNALLHGLAARRPVLPNEDRRAFDAFARAMRKDLRPVGPVQSLLVEEVIEAAWKMRRAEAAQQRVVRHALLPYAGAHRRSRPVTPSRLLADAIGGDARAEPFMVLERYSERLQRSFFAALRRLDRARKQEASQTSEPNCGGDEIVQERAVRDVLRAVYDSHPPGFQSTPYAEVPATNPILPAFSDKTAAKLPTGTR